MNIAVIIAVAILIEGLVEYGKNIIDMFYGGEKKTAIIQMVTIVVGIALAFAFGANMFVPLGLTVNHYIGMVLTGIVMSRGSNYVSDLISRIGQTTVG
jgi:hypothetical protein